MATLLQFIQQLGNWPLEADGDIPVTIFARKPWTAGSEVVLAPLTAELAIPQELLDRGYDYFMEVFQAIDVLEDAGFFTVTDSNADSCCRRLIEYRTNGA